MDNYLSLKGRGFTNTKRKKFVSLGRLDMAFAKRPGGNGDLAISSFGLLRKQPLFPLKGEALNLNY